MRRPPATAGPPESGVRGYCQGRRSAAFFLPPGARRRARMVGSTHGEVLRDEEADDDLANAFDCPRRVDLWLGAAGRRPGDASGAQDRPPHRQQRLPRVAVAQPLNDVRAMARTLREVGFTVLAHENTSKRAMEMAIIEFGRRLADGGVGFFYYAGHGLQVRGRNYLVPVDADIDSEAATRIAAVDVDLLLEQMAEARNRVNVVILDACRNNPFERRLRGASKRLAAVLPAPGTLIPHATPPASVATDADGGNGRYTEERWEALRR